MQIVRIDRSRFDIHYPWMYPCQLSYNPTLTKKVSTPILDHLVTIHPIDHFPRFFSALFFALFSIAPQWHFQSYLFCCFSSTCEPGSARSCKTGIHTRTVILDRNILWRPFTHWLASPTSTLSSTALQIIHSIILSETWSNRLIPPMKTQSIIQKSPWGFLYSDDDSLDVHTESFRVCGGTWCQTKELVHRFVVNHNP